MLRHKRRFRRRQRRDERVLLQRHGHDLPIVRLRDGSKGDDTASFRVSDDVLPIIVVVRGPIVV